MTESDPLNQRWPEIRALFEAALELARTEREAFVCARTDAELAERVLALLVDEDTHGALAEENDGALNVSEGAQAPGVSEGAQAPMVSDGAQAPMDGAPELPGYRLLRVLGQGGMGKVYLAEQLQPKRRVAIKQLTGALTAQSVARFKREADLLARLSHPGIAQIFELGQQANGTPFLVMEYVEGQHLGEYTRPLDRTARLRLLASIADAMEHAHSRGVLHRDLKPSNILVDAGGRAKVLDFGIGFLFEAAESLTATGMVMGTPAYMSPEQAHGRMDLDVRADVYALGAIGYEMVTGRLPIAVSGLTPLQAVQRVITETPMPIGRIDTTLRGDLEVVIETALLREPKLRYPSAGAFADDLRRYLEHEPIRARRANLLRRSWLAARRNPKLAIAAAVSSLSLIGGTIASTYFAIDAQRQAAKAIAEAQTARAIQNFLIDSYTKANPYNTDGRLVSARELLEQGAARVQTELADQPAVRAELHATFGRVFADLEQRPQAEAEFARALDYFQSPQGLDPDRVLHLRAAMAEQQYYRGDVQGALSAFEALREATKTLPKMADLHADMHIGKVMAYLDLGRYPEAVRFSEAEVIPLLLRTRGKADYRYSFAIYNQAIAELYSLQPVAALASIEQVLALDRQFLKPSHPGLVTDVQFVALLLLEFDHVDDALSLSQRAFALRTQHYREDDTITASARGRLAHALSVAGRFDSADAQFQKAIADFRRQRGVETDDIARLRRDYALGLMAVGRLQEAQKQFEIAMATWATLNAAHPEVLRCAAQLQAIAARLGESGALRKLRDIAQQQRSKQHGALPETLALLAMLAPDTLEAAAFRAEAVQLFLTQGRIALARKLQPQAQLSPAQAARVQRLVQAAHGVLNDASATGTEARQ